MQTLEAIAQGQLIVEYVGCVVRSSLVDRREASYDARVGMGTSRMGQIPSYTYELERKDCRFQGLGHYMFRLDDDSTIDATHRGNGNRPALMHSIVCTICSGSFHQPLLYAELRCACYHL